MTLLISRHATRDALERIPQDLITAAPLVHGKVAFEHAPLGAEELDAGEDVGLPCGGELL